MGAKYRHPPEIYKQIAEKYQSGKSCCELARAYNYSEIQITRIVRREGFRVRNASEAKLGRPNYAGRKLRGPNLDCRKYNEAKEKEIVDLYILGLHQDILAKRFGCAKHTIGIILKRQNCPIKGHVGKHNPNYNGGISYDKKGHKRLYLPDYPTASNGMIAEHRFIMEKQIGRYLHHWEIVHHINGIPDDNRSENLQIMTASEHSKLHNNKR